MTDADSVPVGFLVYVRKPYWSESNFHALPSFMIASVFSPMVGSSADLVKLEFAICECNSESSMRYCLICYASAMLVESLYTGYIQRYQTGIQLRR
jgi:hypothetical protein